MGIVLDRLIIVWIVYRTCILYLLFGFSSSQHIPAFYIFGDSLVDAGNNFYIKTDARPVFPNGIDFGTKYGIPSGRYTNGRTFIDIVEQDLGLKNLTPPYLAPATVGNVLLQGVNYASSTAGILNDTGVDHHPITFDKQISYFAKTRQDIIKITGAEAAEKLLRSSIFVAAIGSNDVLKLATSSKQQNRTEQATYLNAVISTFRLQLKRLYNLDARKILITGLGAAGCSPFVMDKNSHVDGCVPVINQLAQAYNRKLKSLTEELTANLVGSQIVYVDVYAISQDIIQKYISYGFENVNDACCRVLGNHGGVIPCIGLSLVCPDRSKYVWWDPFHLTETGNLIVAKHLLDGGLEYVSPMNVRKLMNSSALPGN